MSALTLKHGFKFEDLFETEKLKELTEIFYGYYKSYDKESYNRFAKYSEAEGEGYPEIEVSKILIESGRILDKFLIDFFSVEKESEELVKGVHEEHSIIKVKSEFVTRRVLKKFKEADLASLNFYELDSQVQILKDQLFANLPWKKDALK